MLAVEITARKFLLKDSTRCVNPLGNVGRLTSSTATPSPSTIGMKKCLNAGTNLRAAFTGSEGFIRWIYYHLIFATLVHILIHGIIGNSSTTRLPSSLPHHFVSATVTAAGGFSNVSQ
jgi:hypothetical protein